MSINHQEPKSSFYNKIIKFDNRINNGFFAKTNNKKDESEESDQSPNELLSRILDTINKNSLNFFYPDSNSEFKKKIDSLNLEFYLETEKYLSNKNHSEKCQTSLFIILFKQINIYIDEIRRLNLILIEKRYDPIKIIERTDKIIKKQKEFIVKENLIKALKESKSNMENKLLEAIISENKLKKEIEILKKEKETYKNQINKNNIENNFELQKYKSLNSSLLDERICKTPYENETQISFNNKSTKINKLDNNKFIINNSVTKLYKKGYFKHKIKKIKYSEKKANNLWNNSNSKIIKKNPLFIQLKEEKSYINSIYRVLYTDINQIQIKNNNCVSNRIKKNFITKIKEVNYNEKEKDKKIKDKKVNNSKDKKFKIY